MTKYKLGDHVIIRQGNIKNIGKKVIITKIKPNPDTFLESYVYFVDDEERLYYYYNHLEIDKEWNRNQKIEKLINGLS